MKHLAPILMKHLKGNTTFVDAFGGGMNVVCAIKHNKKIAIEYNRYVCALWKHIQVGGISDLPQSLTEEEYLDIKNSYINQDGKYEDWFIGYVGTCCSHGGAWFNGYAHFNPKRNEDHIKEAFNGMRIQVDGFYGLDETLFVNCSYDEFDYPPHSVIYCDPPYSSTKAYETDFDNIAFWEWVRRMSELGHYVYVSEYNAPSDFKCIWQMKKKDGLGKKEGKEQNIKIEKLFIYNG